MDDSPMRQIDPTATTEPMVLEISAKSQLVSDLSVEDIHADIERQAGK